MELKNLISDEDAVSPVIGVILMVAITVILAAVIGTFVLGLGENVQDSAPQANFQFGYGSAIVQDGAATPNNIDVTTVEITHTGGQDVDPSNIEIQIAGSPALGVDDVARNGTVQPYNGISTISTGTTTTVAVKQTGTHTVGDPAATSNSLSSGLSQINPGETVRVIWTSPSGGTSQTIGQSTVPS